MLLNSTPADLYTSDGDSILVTALFAIIVQRFSRESEDQSKLWLAATLCGSRPGVQSASP